MNETKHTPGEWRYEEAIVQGGKVKWIGLRVIADGKWLGHFYTAEVAPHITWKPDPAYLTQYATKDEAHANARLAIAAPDLLDDLEYIAFAADAGRFDFRELDESEIIPLHITAGAMVDILRHIAKAKGDQS